MELLEDGLLNRRKGRSFSEEPALSFGRPHLQPLGFAAHIQPGVVGPGLRHSDKKQRRPA